MIWMPQIAYLMIKIDVRGLYAANHFERFEYVNLRYSNLCLRHTDPEVKEREIFRRRQIVYLKYLKAKMGFFLCFHRISVMGCLIVCQIILSLSFQEYYTHLKNKIGNNSTWEGAFYKSEWVKSNSSWVIFIFSF